MSDILNVPMVGNDADAATIGDCGEGLNHNDVIRVRYYFDGYYDNLWVLGDDDEPIHTDDRRVLPDGIYRLTVEKLEGHE